MSKKICDAVARLFAWCGALLCIYSLSETWIYSRAVCENAGCQLAAQSTAVPSSMFDVAGVFLFFTLLKLNTSDSKYSQSLLRGLFVYALAAEGVLLSFQLLVLRSFCSKCLIVAACIFGAAIFMLRRGVIGGLVAVTAIIITSYMLVYPVAPVSLTEAAVQVQNPDKILIISPTCPHCTVLLHDLEDANRLAELTILTTAWPTEPIIDPIKRRIYASSETQAINASGIFSVYKALGIDAVPVYIEKSAQSVRILIGIDKISTYLDEVEQPSSTSVSGGSQCSIIQEVCGDTDIEFSEPWSQPSYNSDQPTGR